MSGLLGNSGESASSDVFEGRLNTSDELEDMEARSRQRMQIIYKHSYRCPLCHMTMYQVEVAAKQAGDLADFYLLDVVRFRDVSRAASARWDIRHESPQVLLLKDERVVWHGSHREVEAEAILRQLGLEEV